MPIVSEYESHQITSKFRYATIFPFARSVSVAEEKPEGISADILAKTSPNSWSERQLEETQVKFDKDKDKEGPISVAAVVTVEPKEEPKEEKITEEGEQEGMKETEPEEEAEETKKEGRLAVFGDSDFATDRYFNFSGNGNFFLNTINWLTEEADLISIQPKTSSPRTIHMSATQGRILLFVSLIILPLVVLVTGISVWMRRRSL